MGEIIPETKNDSETKRPGNAPIETGAWQPGAVTSRDAAKPLPAQFSQDVQVAQNIPEVGKRDLPPAGLRKGFDAAKEADDLNEALHPGFWSGRSAADDDRVWQKIFGMSPQEFHAVKAEFDKTHAKKDQPILNFKKTWDLKDDIDLQLGYDRDRLDRLMESKLHNDVPPEHRVNGEALLKPGSGLKVGEMNHVTLPGGRSYDVYIPKNADDRAPVVVAMHGAAGGDSVGLMATESGLASDAEQKGFIAVFATPETIKYDSSFGKADGVAWHAPGRTNLPSQQVNSDDYKYIDSLLKDLGGKSQTSETIGMFGFSDGGRFAQVYAADHPGKVAAVVSEDGTWMVGDKKPRAGMPIMIVHGDADKTLAYNGGMGWTGALMDKVLGTNLDKSAPKMQGAVWKEADACDGPVRTATKDGVTETEYTGCKTGEVKEYIVHGGHHALNDFKNNGNAVVQWILGSPDRTRDFSTQGADFLKRHIVSDPATKD